MILAAATDSKNVPAGIQVVQADPARLLEVVIQVRNQYLLRFLPSAPAAHVEALLNQPVEPALLRSHSATKFPSGQR